MSTLSNILPRWTTNRDTRAGQALRGMFGRPAVALASLTCIALIIVAIFAPWLAPQNPYDLAALDIVDGHRLGDFQVQPVRLHLRVLRQ